MEALEREAMKLSHQLCFPLYAAARSVTGLYTPHLKPLGLTYTQYVTFLALWERDGVTVGELCRQLWLDNGTLSPLLKKLEEQGYLVRRRSEADDRVVVVTLTKKGRDLQEKAKDVPFKVAGCVRLSPEKGALLHDLLYELLSTQTERNEKEKSV